MDDDMNFFAAPPPPVDDDVALAPSGSGDDGDAPIILGAPPEDPIFFDNANNNDNMSPPAYLGDVDEIGASGSFDDGGAAPPIVLVPSTDGGDAFGEETGTGGGELVTSASLEPSPMQKWNAEWQETLLVRKEEENSRRAELVEAARTALEQFQAERDVRRESKMAKNREDEQAKLEAIEADLENDNSWQKVCKMVELSHDSTKQAQDVKRMRDLLILLKNNPAKAEALGA